MSIFTRWWRYQWHYPVDTHWTGVHWTSKTNYSVPKYFHDLPSTEAPLFSGAPTISPLGEGHREILTLENCFAKDLNQSLTQASRQGRWKTSFTFPFQWAYSVNIGSLSLQNKYHFIFAVVCCLLHNTLINFESIPGVNKKSKVFETVLHGFWGFLKLFNWVNHAISLQLSTVFSWYSLLDFLNFLIKVVSFVLYDLTECEWFCPHFVKWSKSVKWENE